MPFQLRARGSSTTAGVELVPDQTSNGIDNGAMRIPMVSTCSFAAAKAVRAEDPLSSIHEAYLEMNPKPITKRGKSQLLDQQLAWDPLISSTSGGRVAVKEHMYKLTLSEPSTTIRLVRGIHGPQAGRVVRWEEAPLPHMQAGSSSVLRAPGAKTASVRGTVSNVAFRPGGLDEPSERSEKGAQREEGAGDADDLFAFEQGHNLLVSPPGFAASKLPPLEFVVGEDGKETVIARKGELLQYKVGMNPEGLIATNASMEEAEYQQCANKASERTHHAMGMDTRRRLVAAEVQEELRFEEVMTDTLHTHPLCRQTSSRAHASMVQASSNLPLPPATHLYKYTL